VRCVGLSGRRRKGNSVIPYFRPSDGSNLRISIFRHVRFKGFMSRQRPNDGSKTAKRSFKSQKYVGVVPSRCARAFADRNFLWPWPSRASCGLLARMQFAVLYDGAGNLCHASVARPHGLAPSDRAAGLDNTSVPYSGTDARARIGLTLPGWS
jgi:hypothetical protein